MKKNLGTRIKHFRRLRGLSQAELARAINADKATVWRWEGGRSWPEFPALEGLAQALDVDVDEFFERAGSPATDDSLRLSILADLAAADHAQVAPLLSTIRLMLDEAGIGRADLKARKKN